jgi:hypothetical protein
MQEVDMSEDKASPQYAVWYFVAATFAFASPVILFQGSVELWATIVTLAGGLLLIVLGGFQLAREIRARRDGRSAE